MLLINRNFLMLLSIIYATVALIHVFIVRPTYLQWGATVPEISLSLSGDAEIPPDIAFSTRALTINAPAAEIWQWIVQLGQDRAGWYSFDWLENLFAANMRNSDSIEAKWQTLHIGDRLPFLEGGSGDTFTAEVTGIEPEQALALEGWTLSLIPIDAQTTRLVVRYPAVDATGANVLYYYPMFEPAHFLMEAGMMLGIKERSEMQESQA